MWQGIVMGIVIMLCFNIIISITIARIGRKHDNDMHDLMVEGNMLREDLNEALWLIYKALTKGEKA